MQIKPVTRFFLKVLLWLPVTFGIWYYMSIITAKLIAIQVDMVLTDFFSDVFAAVGPNGYHLEIWARTLDSHGLAMFKINSLIYSHGLALYTALVLASSDEEDKKWLQWIVGVVLLLIATSWSVCLESVRHVMVDIPELQGKIPFNVWVGRLVFISERYNLLLLPSIMPIIIWIGFHAKFLKYLSSGQYKQIPVG